MIKKITAILLTAAVVLISGISVAYYNTKTFAFDEDARVFSKDDEKITFMDYNFYYKNMDDFVKKVKMILPENHRRV